jgi:hypothetical protein
VTLEIDLERVADVTARLGRHRSFVTTVRDDLADLGRRMHLEAEVVPAVTVGDRLADQLALAVLLLTRQADQAMRADAAPVAAPVARDELRSFAGGSALCSAIQLASPIPSRPSTSGTTGAIDAVGLARDAASLADVAATAPATVAGRAVPLATIAAALSDTLLCRLGVGSGAAISTRTIVDEEGEQVFEGSRSSHKNMDATGMTLDSNLVRRDLQMWNAEHRNEQGFVTEKYPGYPAYEVNAPRD